MREKITPVEIEQFISAGFLKLENVFSEETAEAAEASCGGIPAAIRTILLPGPNP